VGPRTGLDAVERRKILPVPELELRPFGRPARSQSLYRLHYPGSLFSYVCMNEMLSLVQEGSEDDAGSIC
jgi:hypothetical protein